MIRHRCPVCGEAQEHSPSTAGMSLPCKHCRSLIEVPRDSTTSAAAARRFTAADAVDIPGVPPRPLLDTVGGWVGAHTGDGPPPPMNVGKRVMYALLGLFLFVLFGGIGAYGAYSFVESAASQRWPSVEGKVEGAGVTEKVTRTSRGRRRVEHHAVVRYEYAVNGQKHTGARIAFGDGQNYSFLAQALASRYKPGQKVTVYYDPSDPNSAVLRREVLFGGYLMTAVGVFVGYIGLRLLLSGLAPTTGSSSSRWLPWSRRLTWTDLPMMALGVIGLVLWVPMIFGI